MKCKRKKKNTFNLSGDLIYSIEPYMVSELMPKIKINKTPIKYNFNPMFTVHDDKIEPLDVTIEFKEVDFEAFKKELDY